MPCFVPSITPLRFTAITRSYSSSVVSASGAGAPIPATLSTASTVPKASSAEANMASTDASSETSTRTGTTASPSASAVSSCLPLMSAASTLAPSRTNTSADARPIPDPAPVMTATFPSSSAMHVVVVAPLFHLPSPLPPSLHILIRTLHPTPAHSFLALPRLRSASPAWLDEVERRVRQRERRTLVVGQHEHRRVELRRVSPPPFPFVILPRAAPGPNLSRPMISADVVRHVAGEVVVESSTAARVSPVLPARRGSCPREDFRRITPSPKLLPALPTPRRTLPRHIEFHPQQLRYSCSYVATTVSSTASAGVRLRARCAPRRGSARPRARSAWARTDGKISNACCAPGSSA